ncbi:MAG TPA: sugar phosphate isomerase/epimerase family protein [Phycisphaerae bacterium]|nr:sugar phosphate isomerase/epimerase family protein [Phycisphaerae bacterium]HRY68775.1 sugar phosphate isomerase/epimerase family protein [Phycisphaerae bacterium]HSA28902.1 sugar phosphate isomerase/epimerase family protein [Phycisphaerae bacterium]
MQIGVNLMLWTGCYTPKDVKLIDKVGKLGFDGVEFPMFDPAQVDVKGTRKALEGNGLGGTVCTVLVTGSFISSSPADRKKAVDHVTKVLKVSKAVGMESVAGPLYSPVGYLTDRGPNAAEWKNAVKCLKQVAKVAEDLDLPIGIEAINRFETYFLNTQADAAKLCQEIGSDYVGVHYDTFHANIEERDPVAALKAIGSKWLKHVHASENDRGVPGTGHVPWDETFKTLKALKYDGWINIESFLPAIKELARAASIWRPLARSGDDLATRGLKFLRKYVK